MIYITCFYRKVIQWLLHTRGGDYSTGDAGVCPTCSGNKKEKPACGLFVVWDMQEYAPPDGGT